MYHSFNWNFTNNIKAILHRKSKYFKFNMDRNKNKSNSRKYILFIDSYTDIYFYKYITKEINRDNEQKSTT